MLDSVRLAEKYIGPVAVTVGGCTPRNYGFDPAEKKLIDAYERCPRPKG